MVGEILIDTNILLRSIDDHSVDYGIAPGKQTHDTHLVAVMQANQIASVLTFNGRDFARFAGINVLDPHTIN